jgi:hypothetical protein
MSLHWPLPEVAHLLDWLLPDFFRQHAIDLTLPEITIHLLPDLFDSIAYRTTCSLLAPC